jgi:glucose/arabinose dehydrogenase
VVLAALSLLLAPLRTDAQEVVLTDAFPSLTFPAPVGLQHAGDGTDRLFIVRQAGYIVVVENTPDATEAKTFLDIDSLVESGGELGLLGLAFHPSYDTNGYFYVDYTRASPLRTVISRFKVSASNPDSADPASEVVLLEILQPYTNHNGGQLAFGPDGYLYIALGDGGSGGDPGNRAQDRTTLLGKILRIDVDTPGDTLNYSIPPTNPYAGNTDGSREEIFAYGLRNPWRFSFDALTGAGWVGDVGQGEWEEVDTLTAGGNYGWRLKEGNHCYTPPTGCDTIPGLIDPVWEYSHSTGGCSITGGFVYRGAMNPSLVGKYLFGDYCSGKLWALDTNGAGEWTAVLLLDSPYSFTSFGIDRHNEVYICTASGRIYRIASLEPAFGVGVNAGWNIVALPLDGTEEATDSLFPTATSEAFGYEPGAGYTTHDTLHPGPGYWMKFAVAQEVSFTGDARSADTIDVTPGWNIVGGLSVPVDVDSVATSPAGILASNWYGFDRSYLVASTLDPGRGYWVKVSLPGQLILRGASPGSPGTASLQLRR